MQPEQNTWPPARAAPGKRRARWSAGDGGGMRSAAAARERCVRRCGATDIWVIFAATGGSKQMG